MLESIIYFDDYQLLPCHYTLMLSPDQYLSRTDDHRLNKFCTRHRVTKYAICVYLKPRKKLLHINDIFYSF